MIARPKISQNEWKTAEKGAFEVGNFALLSCPGPRRPRGVALVLDVGRQVPRQRLEQAVRERRARRLDDQQPVERRRVAPRVVDLGSTRVIQRRFNVSVPRAIVPEKASTLRDRSER